MSEQYPNGAPAIDPRAMARRDLTKALPRRFYKEVGVAEGENGFALTLDGRVARTPAKAPLATPTRPAAEALAEEWRAQTDVLDPAAMPLTRIVNSALDGVAREIQSVRAEIVRYAASDLLCYRADKPLALVAAQAEAWDPPLDWAARTLDANLALCSGVIFTEQPSAAIEAVRAAVADVAAPLPLTTLNVMTTLTGSAVLALAVARGRLSAAEAWSAAHVDEDFQMREWGADAEALDRRARRWREMEAAATLLALCA